MNVATFGWYGKKYGTRTITVKKQRMQEKHGATALQNLVKW